jgi:hypothetical protein
MRNTSYVILAVVLVALLAAGLAYRQYNSTDAVRGRLLDDFVACVPDSVGSDGLEEIRSLVEILWTRYDQGWVDPNHLSEVEQRMRAAVDNRYIGGRDLTQLMASVGYYTYAGQPEYNVEDGSVDHPELNPEAGMVQMGVDSTTWEEFYEWKRQMIEEGRIDSTGRFIPEVERMEAKKKKEEKN